MKRITYFFLFFASFLMSACVSVHTAQICEITPVYTSTINCKATINDVETPIKDDVFQDDNVRIRIVFDSTHSKIGFGITNLKGGLMNFNTMESSFNGDFIESYPSKSPWIPKNETFFFKIPLSYVAKEKVEKLVLMAEIDYFDAMDYKIFRDKIYSKIKEKEDSKPSSYSDNSYFSFVIHFYEGTYCFYKVTYNYTLEGVKYDIKTYEKEYRNTDELNQYR